LFFDEASIEVRAGGGGNGCVSFRREKYIPLGGPNGGNGGRGGHVYLRVNAQLNTLIAFTRRRHFIAERGGHGLGKGMQGASGADVYVEVPPGTVVRDKKTGDLLAELLHDGQQALVARGGRGGRGNEVFKTSTRQSPRFAEKGAPGEERLLTLELKLIADVGLLGKPNAGKSTLLARVSAARPKIADYPFTTLQPNLGVVEVDSSAFLMADIPGLIEGAHEGVGLGMQFLRHVERTRLLIHLLDGASPDPAADYYAINRELALYSDKLAAKPQIVVLNKMDLTGSDDMLALVGLELGPEVPLLAISAVSGQGVRELLRLVAQRLAELPVAEPAQELFVFRPHLEQEESAFTVERENGDQYRVHGQEIERLAVMTDWSSEEALERFERIMIARGVSEQLELAGVRVGDTVHIGAIELEWR
jgi:GTP-binding protein